MNKAWSVKKTALELGKSTWTMSSWIKAGRITPLSGTGGQGRKAEFDPAAVVRLRDNLPGSEFLARARYAFEQDRAGIWRLGPSEPPWNMSPGVIKYLNRKRPMSKLLPDDIELVSLSAVPAAIKDWANQVVKGLSEKQVRFLIAVFVASEYPPDLPELKRYPEATNANRELHRLIAMQHFQERYLPLKELRKKRIDFENQEAMQKYRTGELLYIRRSQDYEPLKKIVSELFPKERRALSSVIRSNKLETAQAKLKNAFPTRPAVAKILGVSRIQGWRIWDNIPNKYRKQIEDIFKNPVCPEPKCEGLGLCPEPKCEGRLERKGDIIKCSKCSWQRTKEELQEAVINKARDKKMTDKDIRNNVPY